MTQFSLSHHLSMPLTIIAALAVTFLSSAAARRKVLAWKAERGKKNAGTDDCPDTENQLPAETPDSIDDNGKLTDQTDATEVNDETAPTILTTPLPSDTLHIAATKPLCRFFTGVLFMPDEVDLCWTYFASGHCERNCTRRRQHHRSHEAALWKLLNNIRLARSSIDMCMHTLTHPLVCIVLRQVIKWTDGKVKVRVILDGSLVEMRGGLYEDLLEDGFPVLLYKLKPGDPPSLLHHKFVIIDNELVMSGSYNWTVKGCRRNYENIICTVDGALVLPYVTEFARLWKMLDEEARRKMCQPPSATAAAAKKAKDFDDVEKQVRESSGEESLLDGEDEAGENFVQKFKFN